MAAKLTRRALEHELVHRLLDHVEHGWTDMAGDVLQLPATNYYASERFEEELLVLFLDHPLVLGLSGMLPGPNTYRTLDVCDTPLLLTRDEEGRVHLLANVCRHR